MAYTCTDVESIYNDIPNCPGKKSLPGVLAEVFGASKHDIIDWPELPEDPATLAECVKYKGNFLTAADKYFFRVGLIDDKNQLLIENQGEEYSKTNKVTANMEIPGTAEEVTGLVHKMNNDDMIFLIRNRNGKCRVVGNKDFHVKLTMSQDSGQAVTDANSTKVSAEVTDWAPAPFYEGTIPTADGDLNVVTGKYEEKAG